MPVAVNVLVMTGGGGRTVNTSVAEPEPPALAALMVKEMIPVAVGVPEITPVEVLILNPVGSPVALKLVGLLVAVML